MNDSKIIESVKTTSVEKYNGVLLAEKTLFEYTI